MPRYADKKIIMTDQENLRTPDFSEDNIASKRIRHYDTIVLKNPTILDRANLATTNHVWSYGDRYYKLASRYYSAPNYWWVIAWYNGRPTEAHISTGDVIVVPLNLEAALIALRSY